MELIGAKSEAIRKAEERELFRAAMDEIGLKLVQGAHGAHDGRSVGGRGVSSVTRSSSVPRSRWVAPAVASRTPPRSSRRRSSGRSTRAPSTSASWRRARWVGRSTSSRSSAIRPTTSRSSARSKTSTPWGFTPATRSPSRRAMTLTDREYQRMRDAARKIITEIGVETGGSNIQFAVNPADGRLVVIEMNPRVSVPARSPPRPRVIRSPRSRRSSPSDTRSTSCATTSREPARRSSRRSTTWSSSGRASPSRSSTAPTRGSPRR